MEIAKRLLLLIKKLNLNKKQFANSINISPGNFSDWINPKKNTLPSTEAIFRIKEVHKVNLNWLFTGDGSILGDREHEKVIMNTAYKVGDIVELVSGSNLMTVIQVNTSEVICNWTNVNDELKEAKFPLEAVRRV